MNNGMSGLRKRQQLINVQEKNVLYAYPRKKSNHKIWVGVFLNSFGVFFSNFWLQLDELN